MFKQRLQGEVYFCCSEYQLMNIGFDAKRAFHNGTGLGQYSRNLISSMAQYYPGHHYFLFTPSVTGRFNTSNLPNVQTVIPGSFLGKQFPSAWRSKWMRGDIKIKDIRLYHGLSHEIPIGLGSRGIKTVVTIHDLIHERFQKQYNRADVVIYRKKFWYACNHADRVVAISRQTRQDILDFYGVPEEKIEVIYQSCSPHFKGICSEKDIQLVKGKYGLPEAYFLYVGSIIERKNLLGICKALKLLEGSIRIPLAVIGEGNAYKRKVQKYLADQGMENRLIWLSENPSLANPDFPAIYQGALALVYPSLFEGFGIPILEALWSRLPVITSLGSCFGETAGEAAIYVNPSKEEDIAKALWQIYSDPQLRSALKEKGLLQAVKFSAETCAGNMMKLYESLVKE